MSKVMAVLAKTKESKDSAERNREKAAEAARVKGLVPKAPKHKFNGKPIVNATEPFTFRVYPRDAVNGKQKDPMSCAIANSLLRKQGVRSVRIGLRVAQVEFAREVKRYSIDKEDTKKIIAFDRSHYFAPGEYTLRVPVTYKATDKRAGRKHGVGGGHRKNISERAPICTTGRHMSRSCKS